MGNFVGFIFFMFMIFILFFVGIAVGDNSNNDYWIKYMLHYDYAHYDEKTGDFTLNKPYPYDELKKDIN